MLGSPLPDGGQWDMAISLIKKYGNILEMERPQTEESLRKHPRMTLLANLRYLLSA